MAYNVSIYNSATQSEKVFTSEATTWGQLKDEVSQLGFNFPSEYKAIIANNDVELIDRTSVINRFNADGSAIPDDEEIAIVVTQKKAKGAASKKESIEDIAKEFEGTKFNYNTGRSFLSRLKKAGFEVKENFASFKGQEVVECAEFYLARISVRPSNQSSEKSSNKSKPSKEVKEKLSKIVDDISRSTLLERLENLENKFVELEEKYNSIIERSLASETSNLENVNVAEETSSQNVETAQETEEERLAREEEERLKKIEAEKAEKRNQLRKKRYSDF